MSHGNLGKERSTTHQARYPATVRNLVWAAGFLEGEGSFQYAHSSQQTSASQVNIKPLIRLRDIFGGNIHHAKVRPKHSQLHKWQASGSRARGIMMTLYIEMSAKRRAQIRRALRR